MITTSFPECFYPLYFSVILIMIYIIFYKILYGSIDKEKK